MKTGTASQRDRSMVVKELHPKKTVLLNTLVSGPNDTLVKLLQLRNKAASMLATFVLLKSIVSRFVQPKKN